MIVLDYDKWIEKRLDDLMSDDFIEDCCMKNNEPFEREHLRIKLDKTNRKHFNTHCSRNINYYNI